jgi:hypothetical protein
MYAASNDSTDNVQIQIFASRNDITASITNYERMAFGYRNDSTYVIGSVAGGDGTVHPIELFTQGNSNQIYLEADDGEVGINCIPNGYQLDVNGTLGADSLTMDPNGTSSPLSSFTFASDNDPVWTVKNEGGISSTLKWDGVTWTLGNKIIVSGDIALSSTSDLLFTTVGGNIGNGTDSNPTHGWFDGTVSIGANLSIGGTLTVTNVTTLNNDLIVASDIGITAHTDLIQLTDQLVSVNGAITATGVITFGNYTSNGYLKTSGGIGTVTEATTIPVGDLTGTLPVANGGTGLTTYTQNSMLYASATNTLAETTNLTWDESLLDLSGGVNIQCDGQLAIGGVINVNYGAVVLRSQSSGSPVGLFGGGTFTDVNPGGKSATGLQFSANYEPTGVVNGVGPGTKTLTNVIAVNPTVSIENFTNPGAATEDDLAVANMSVFEPFNIVLTKAASSKLVTGNVVSNFKCIDATLNGGATIDDFYGLLVPDLTAGDTNYAIKTGLGKVDFGDTLDVTGVTTLDSTLFIKETASGGSADVAGYGQLYCKDNGGTTELWFVNDAGTETQLA